VPDLPGSSYNHLDSRSVITCFASTCTYWINDGLMVVFFFTVGIAILPTTQRQTENETQRSNNLF